MAQIVFVTLFLGLVSGVQTVDLRTDSAIRSIRITLGGHEVATVHQPPWHAKVDFGAEIEPRELVATGYDTRGDEIARTTQIINLPHPVAELEIVPAEDRHTPSAFELLWHHRQHASPKRVSMTLDGARLLIGKPYRAVLPRLDSSRPHILAAEMRFDDGAVARAELVIDSGIGYSDSVGTQLTPIALKETGPPRDGSLEGCFSAHGVAVRTAAVEETNALVNIVKDPDPSEAEAVLDPERRLRRRGGEAAALRHQMQLDPGTTEWIILPIGVHLGATGQPAATLFLPSRYIAASEGGLPWLLTQRFKGVDDSLPRQFADAVAVSGLRTLNPGRRRAVVLLLSRRPDASNLKPIAVRHYLAAIGVPLFVWSLTGPRPDVAGTWGEVDDISTSEGMRIATDRLRETLAGQRIAWVAVDPLTALRVEAKEGCGVVPMTRLHHAD
jgi:hypothetical protein